MVIFVERKYSL